MALTIIVTALTTSLATILSTEARTPHPRLKSLVLRNLTSPGLILVRATLGLTAPLTAPARRAIGGLTIGGLRPVLGTGLLICLK